MQAQHIDNFFPVRCTVQTVYWCSLDCVSDWKIGNVKPAEIHPETRNPDKRIVGLCMRSSGWRLLLCPFVCVKLHIHSQSSISSGLSWLVWLMPAHPAHPSLSSLAMLISACLSSSSLTQLSLARKPVYTGSAQLATLNTAQNWQIASANKLWLWPVKTHGLGQAPCTLT